MKHPIEGLVWRELVWARPYKIETVWETLSHLAALSPRGAVIWEVHSRNGKVRYLLGAAKRYIRNIEEAIKAHGDIQFHEVSAEKRIAVTAARQLKISRPILSLKTDITQAVIRAGLAALTEDKSGTEIVIQVVLGRAYAPSPVPANLVDPNATWLQILLGDVQKATAESRKTVKEKSEQHTFQATIRIGTTGENTSFQIHSIISAFKVLEAAGVRIREEDSKISDLNTAHVPWHFPLQLSVKELANFLLLPAGEEELPGTPGLHPKLTLPPNWYKNPTNQKNDRSFAVSMNATNPKRLSISPRDSLEHCHLIGPTGSGKSTAMLHLILSDINAGRSVLVLDPKTDLVNDVLMRIPEERIDDLVIIDSSDSCPCGFNPLAFKDYGSPSLIADAILSVLKEIFSDCWGIYTQDVLTAALLTLVGVEDATLLWLLPLLTDENFRRKITSKVKDRMALRPFWEQFEALRDTEKKQQISPVLNKLRQLTLRPGLRNVLGQAKPKFSLMDLFYKRKVVLVPLNKGLTGGESARLLGSLIVGLTWTLALSRAGIPAEKRHIVEIYIDELQDYLSLPTDLSDALAQARGLGVGLTLAHQYRDQLPINIRSGIDANARNKIVFGLSSKDAKDMAAMAPELTAEDFMTLPRYQIYTSFQSNGRNTGWVQGKTLSPPPALRNAADLKASCQAIYGIPAEQIEEEYLNIFTTNNRNAEENPGDINIGRKKRP
ncbi:type IV secretory system conjugative DNA transfer family protein [Sporofaciens sp. JLR.KK001]|uniref:type IV secretory system conjugative DNA transfer family protein n=1 Tax=Sporofaciens sp. JLR.KK001 TaxID=3112621 RepID=UPI002FF3A8AC